MNIKQGVAILIIAILMSAAIVFGGDAGEDAEDIAPTLTDEFYSRLSATIAGLDTPEKLLVFNNLYFEYVDDSEIFDVDEYWQYPDEFFVLRKGDCEDYAWWNWLVLEMHEYNPKMILLLGSGGNDEGHSVVKYTTREGNERYMDYFVQYDKIDECWEHIIELENPEDWLIFVNIYNQMSEQGLIEIPGDEIIDVLKKEVSK